MPPIPMLLCLPPLARPLGSVGVPFLGGQGWTLMDCRQGDSPLALPPPHPFTHPQDCLSTIITVFNAFVLIFLAVNSFSSVFFFLEKMGKCTRQPLPRLSEPGLTQYKRAWGRMWPARKHRMAFLL